MYAGGNAISSALSDLSPVASSAVASLSVNAPPTSSSTPGLATTPAGGVANTSATSAAAAAENLGNSVFYDSADASGNHGRMLEGQRQKLEQLEAKMEKKRYQIKHEQSNQDSNVNEYLQMASNVKTNVQMTRVKEMFE